MAELSMDHRVTTSEWPEKLRRFITKDGGLSIQKLVPDDGKLSDLCAVESATLLADSLYTYNLCEHTAQVAIFGFGNGRNPESTILDFTYSSFPAADAPDPVYAPQSLMRLGDRIFLPSNIETGPAIFELIGAQLPLRSNWRGSISDGKILSSRAQQDIGYVLFSTGKLLRSTNTGRTWEHFRNIPFDKDDPIVGFEFLSTSQIFILTETGRLLYSSDAGITWSSVYIREDTQPKTIKVVSSNGRMFMLADFNSIYSSDDGRTWSRVDFDREKRIDDIAIQNEKLHVLAEGELFIQTHY